MRHLVFSLSFVIFLTGCKKNGYKRKLALDVKKCEIRIPPKNQPIREKPRLDSKLANHERTKIFGHPYATIYITVLYLQPKVRLALPGIVKEISNCQCVAHSLRALTRFIKV
jgi:hypothetical protein